LSLQMASRRISTGEKHRGFGEGMHTVWRKARTRRVLMESAKRTRGRTGICVPIERMAITKLGTLWFTFEDSPVEMVVHVFESMFL
jgi:hypothetical protein